MVVSAVKETKGSWTIGAKVREYVGDALESVAREGLWQEMALQEMPSKVPLEGWEDRLAVE